MLSVHTSPLDQPGKGDAGGLNVYIVEVSKRLADTGTAVEIFTRATSSSLPPIVEVHPGVLVRHIQAGPFEELQKEELPAQLCAFTAGALREEARHPPGYYDIIHSHYWLSGQVGWLARDRWGIPLIHTAHTLAKVKNEALAEGAEPEPRTRTIGEEQVVAEADRLVANTHTEAQQLVQLYNADPSKTTVIPPGVDLERYTPGPRSAARRKIGIPEDTVVLLYVGRLQPLKGVDTLLAAAKALSENPALRNRLQVHLVGGDSSTGTGILTHLEEYAALLEIREQVHFHPPQRPEQLAEHYRAADVTVVPSHSESFGLVALESQACGTPVVAANVGGLPTAVQDQVSGILVTGHDPTKYAEAIHTVLDNQETFAAGARRHATKFSWDQTTRALLDTYSAAGREMVAKRWRAPAAL